jgi:hypothetical protein
VKAKAATGCGCYLSKFRIAAISEIMSDKSLKHSRMRASTMENLSLVMRDLPALSNVLIL